MLPGTYPRNVVVSEERVVTGEVRTTPRQHRGRLSIEKILDAADGIVRERGHPSFTTAELAAVAGVSIGRLYYWFPDQQSVVNALAERGAQRLVAAFSAGLATQQRSATPLAVRSTVMALCDYIDANPASVALCLTGGVDSAGQLLRQQLVAIVRDAVEARVATPREGEIDLVAQTTVAIVLGMLDLYLRSPDHSRSVADELTFVLAAWLYGRYPSRDDRVWEDDTVPIRPAGSPLPTGDVRLAHVYPALVNPEDDFRRR